MNDERTCAWPAPGAVDAPGSKRSVDRPVLRSLSLELVDRLVARRPDRRSENVRLALFGHLLDEWRVRDFVVTSWNRDRAHPRRPPHSFSFPWLTCADARVIRAKRFSASSSSARSAFVIFAARARSRAPQLGAHEDASHMALATTCARVPRVRLELDEAKRCEPPQRFADRRAADAVLLGELVLAQHLSRLELAG